MRLRFVFTVVPVLTSLLAACSSGSDTTSPKSTDSSPGNSGTPDGKPGASGGGGGGGTNSGGGDDGTSGSSRAGPEIPGEPEVMLVGRFDRADPAAPKTAWPGSRMIARFQGTAVNAKLTQLNGPSGGNSWFNVIVDGVVTKKVEATGASGQIIELASGLAAGTHVVELEKRTEANVGMVTFEGFTFPDGKLLAPPTHPTRRIEFVSDSTIDGFGSDGDAVSCAGGEPASLNNVRKSVAFVSSSILNAESHVIAYSGKGLVRNEGDDPSELFSPLYGRTLPDVTQSAWDFNAWTPDVVVVSLGGTDLTTDAPPAGFQSAYDMLVTSIRAHYPNAHIYMTVWSQIKDFGVGLNIRTALKGVLDGIKAAHASDTKLHVFMWKEADHILDETGCSQHANEAHGIATANEIVPVIKADASWN